jgi:glutamate-5-semialdehyde dehydrogenase
MNEVEILDILGKKGKEASYKLMNLSSFEKDNGLNEIKNAIINNKDAILEANAIDLRNAINSGMSEPMQDRLLLNDKRIVDMAKGVEQIIAIPDPVGEVLGIWNRPNGLRIGKKRVPLGVVGIIYESRPNVTLDAAVLCLKTGNSVILRGGSEAINSNIAIVKIIRKALKDTGISEDAVGIVEDTSRETCVKLMRLNKYLDVLIPRGGANLISSVVNNSTVPVIETGVGNCHVYVDESADFEMAKNIIINAKTSRPSVCNSLENLLVDSKIAKQFIPMIFNEMLLHKVEIRCCENSLRIWEENKTTKTFGNVKACTEEDLYTEFLDLIISVKLVGGLEEAITHINNYGSGHSESIITSNYESSQKFLDAVDAAAVYVNASTRFTDGFEFGFGAEIGISTQKLHARGPMGLKELTTTKYIIYGNGQIR